MILAVPVEPGASQGRQWVTDELSKPAYAAAKPTPFDLAANAVAEWFEHLFQNRGGVAPNLLAVAGVIVVVALVVVAVIVFGLPRVQQRTRTPGSLFGDDDTRSAAELRRAAEAALAAGDFGAALLDRYRALARDLDDRTVVSVLPGTTASAFARAAGAGFPAERDGFAAAAQWFDGVRYADRPATRAQAEAVRDLDARVAAARPALAAAQ